MVHSSSISKWSRKSNVILLAYCLKDMQSEDYTYCVNLYGSGRLASSTEYFCLKLAVTVGRVVTR